MSIPEQIRALEALASMDAELKILDEQLSKERATLDGLRATVARLDEKLTIDRALVAAKEKSRNELTTDVRGMNQQLEHSRDKLGRARSEREVNAVQREMDELRKLVRDREEEIGKLTTEADALRQQVETGEAERQRVAAELSSKDGETRARLSDMDGQRTQRGAEREAQAKLLPPVLFRRYEMVRGRRGVAIAQTSDGTCRMCHIALPPQMFHKLRREPLLEQCPSCNRIIYFVAPVGLGGAGPSAPPPRS